MELGDLDSGVADADIRLGDRGVWSVDGLRLVRDLLQVAVRSQHVLRLAGVGRGDDGSAIIVGNSGIADGDDGQKTHEL